MAVPEIVRLNAFRNEPRNLPCERTSGDRLLSLKCESRDKYQIDEIGPNGEAEQAVREFR